MSSFTSTLLILPSTLWLLSTTGREETPSLRREGEGFEEAAVATVIIVSRYIKPGR